MLDIEYKGGNCVKITTKKSSLVIDPKIDKLGLKNQDASGCIQLVTEEENTLVNAGSSLLINCPGEYEVGDFIVKGMAVKRSISSENDSKDGILYRVEVCGVRIAVLGNIDKNLDEEMFEKIGVVDVVIIPVGGGGYTLDPSDAANLCRKIEPSIVIPVHYADAGIQYPVHQEQFSVFTSELKAHVEKSQKYKIKSVTSLPQTLTIIELQR